MKHIESNQDAVCIAVSTIIGEKTIICRSLQSIKLIRSPTSYHSKTLYSAHNALIVFSKPTTDLF